MLKLNTPMAINSLAVAVMTVLSLSVSAATITNSVSENSITIDGDLNDWANVASLGYDADTLSDVNTQADYLEGWLAHDSSSFYIAYRNNGDINESAWWSWQVYIDTDESESTGYQGFDDVGADYLLQASGLYKYTGSGTDWSWQYIATVTNAVDGALAEFKIPRSLLGNPSNVRTLFKARNSAFTGSYSVSGIDTYPRSSTAIPMHDDLLFRQSSIWNEEAGTLSMDLASNATSGATQLEMDTSYPLVDDQLITYLSSDGEYYTAHVKSVSGTTVSLHDPLQAPIKAGQNVWNFYENGSHPNEVGYRAIADFVVREIGLSNLNTGRHVMLGDSWFDSPGVSERLSDRLVDATIINKGIGGNTSTNLLDRFDSDVTSQNPDFVWVIAGVNDYNQDVPVATYLASMQGIIAKISSIGAQGVIIDSPVGQLFYGNDDRRQLSHSYSEALSSNGDGYVDYEFGEVIPPTETGDISNPKTINIDGDLSDWSELQSFGADGDDINEAGSRADILEGWMAHDDSNFYMAYLNDGDIDQGTWWPWQTYLDTDNDEDTGFKIGNGVGANYIIQGGSLHRYIGSGSDWSWEYVVAADYKINGDIVELALPRTSIGNPSSMNAIMKGRNGIFTGNYSSSGMDSYPDVGSEHLNYNFEDITQTSNDTFSNEVDDYSIDLNGNLDDWSAVTSFGSDPDDIADASSQADWLEAWAAHDSNNLYFAYQNDGAISSTSWPYQIYIDTDNDPTTGFLATDSMGAELVLEGSTLRSYNGDGNSWTWDTYAVTGSSTVGAYSEIAIPRSALNGVSDFRVMFKARNQPFTGSYDASGIDYFPNDAATSAEGYFSYSME